MANKIQVKRGLRVNLPTLDIGEPALTTDDKAFHIGTDSGNIELATREQINSLVEQSNWIAATLMNGWTEELHYTKNDLGLVTIRANILAGTTVADFTHIGVIPSGYRPNIAFIVIPLVDFSTGDVKFMYVNSTTGNITIAPNQSFINNHKYTGIVTYYVN